MRRLSALAAKCSVRTMLCPARRVLCGLLSLFLLLSCGPSRSRDKVVGESEATPSGPCPEDRSHTLLGQYLGTQLFRPRSLERLAVSRDGAVLMSAGGSEAVLWDPVEGRALRRFEAWSGKASLSADGAFLAMLDFGFMGSTLEVRAVDSGAVRQSWKVDGNSVERLALDHTGAYLASSLGTGVVELRHVGSDAPPRPLTGHQGSLRDMAFSPTDAGRLVTAGEKGQLRLWDTQAGQAQELEAGQKSVMAVAFSADGTRLVAGDSDGIVYIYSADGERLRSFPAVVPGEPGEIRGVAVTDDARRLLVGTWSGVLALWDVENAKLIAVLGEGGLIASALAFTPDGKTAIGGINWGAIRFWDAENGRERAHAGEGNLTDTKAIAWAADGHRAVVAAGGGWANVWDMRCGRLAGRLDGHSRRVEQLAATPDGRMLATGDNAGFVRLWDGQSLQLVHARRHHGGDVDALALSGDGRLVASGSTLGSLVVRETATDRLVFERAPEQDANTVFALALSADGSLLVSGDTMGRVEWLDVATGAPLAIRTDDYPSNVRSIRFSPSGRYLSTTASDKVRVFDTGTAALLLTFKAPGWSITNADWFADDRRLAFGDSDGHLWIADIQAGQVLRAHAEEDLDIRAVALRPGDAALLSGHRNTTLRLWDPGRLPALSADSELALEVERPPDDQRDSAHSLPRSAALQCQPGEDRADERLPACAIGRLDPGPWRLEGAMESDLGVLRFSDDGALLAAASGERLAIHELPSGRVQHRLSCCMVAPQAALFAPDNKWLALTPYAGRTQIWQLDEGRREATWSRSARALAVSPDGSLWAGADKEGAIWSSDRAGQDIRELAVNGRVPVQRLAFSPDGQRLLALRGWQGVDLWQVRTGRALWSLYHDDGALPAGLGDDYLMWAGFDQKGQVEIITPGHYHTRTASGQWSSEPIDLVTQEGWSPESSEPCAPDGRLCAVHTGTEVRLGSVAGPARTLPVGPTDRFALAPGGRWLIQAAEDTLTLWDVAGSRRLGPAPEPLIQGPLSLANDSTLLTLHEREVRLWRLPGNRPHARFAHQVASALLSPDGRFAVAVQKDLLLRLDIASGQVRTLSRGKFPGSLALSGDGLQVAVIRSVGEQQAALEVFAVSTGKRLATRALSGDLYRASVALSRTGRRVAWTTEGKVEIWTPDNDRLVALDVEHDVEHLAFTPDEATLLTGGAGHLESYAADTGAHQGFLGDHANVQSFALTADGRHLVSGGLDQLVRVFDMQRRRLLAVLPGHQRWVVSVAVSSDPARAVSLDAGGHLFQWDLTPWQ